jgi:hypothetical protein
MHYISSQATINAYEYSGSDPIEFRPMGWIANYVGKSTRTFKQRFITITEKAYLSSPGYLFLKNSLIPLDANRFLDFSGAQTFKQDLETITNLSIEYAQYVKHRPVPTVLYHATGGTGKTEVTGLNLSNYDFIVVRARASGTFTWPLSTTFATKNIEDCGGTMVLQIADPSYYCTWNVTNTGFTLHGDANSSSYYIFDVIGYKYQ